MHACMHLKSGKELRVATHEWDVLSHEQHKSVSRDSSSQGILDLLTQSKQAKAEAGSQIADFVNKRIRTAVRKGTKQVQGPESLGHICGLHLQNPVDPRVRGSVVIAAAAKHETPGGEREMRWQCLLSKCKVLPSTVAG